MLKKILLVFAVLMTLLGLYTAAGFFLLPRLARDKLPEVLSQVTGQTVQLQAVNFDPFELKADLQGFNAVLADGKPLFSFEALAVDVEVFESIKRRTLILGSVLLRNPVINIERAADGRFNFSGLIEKLSQPGDAGQQASDSNAPPVLIRQVVLEEGQITWDDFSTGQELKETLLPVNFTLSEFTTQPDSKAKFGLSVTVDSGGGLELRGEFNLSTLSSDGHIKLDEIALTKVWQMFLQDLMPLEIADGKVSLQADYSLNANDPANLQLSVVKGDIAVKQLALTEKSKTDPLINMPILTASGIRLNLQNQQIDVASVSSNSANIKAWLQADGQINYQTLFAANSAAVAQEPVSVEPGKPWQINLRELVLANYQLAFVDHSQAKPVEMVFDELNLSVRDYRNVDGVKLPMQFATRFNQRGYIKIGGEFALSPFSANLAVELQKIKLKTFQTYLDPFLNLELTDGNLNTQGFIQLGAADELQISYQGDAKIENLITRDKAKNLDFVKWASLDLKQMVLDANKQDFKLAKVIFDQPYVRFTIKKDGSTNVSDILVAKAGDKSEVKPAIEKSAKTQNSIEPVVTIGKIELRQGQSDFADYSLILPFVVKMNGLAGEVDGFASNTDAAAKLKLHGKVRDLATVKIGGNYQFQSGDSDIAMSFKHLPLPLVTPYMAEFAGYRIEKGQMALDLNYTIKHGQLTAQNKIFIDQLVLGDKVENPKAVSLPLELAVALLKDADGKINLDFPVTGSLEDPEFSVGSLVTDVLVNVITKAVSSPFKAIASMLDSDDDLSTIVFAAGNGGLSPEETAKLEQIAKALSAKPELVLEIKGVAYESQDWPVMRSDALADILKKMKSGELRDKGEVIRSEYIELSEAEYKRLLTKFYAEVFPQKIDHSLFGAPRIKGQPDADFYSVARSELESIMEPDPQRLNELAVARANQIAKYLVERGGVDRGRIYILATELKQQAAEDGISSHLSLNVAS